MVEHPLVMALNIIEAIYGEWSLPWLWVYYLLVTWLTVVMMEGHALYDAYFSSVVVRAAIPSALISPLVVLRVLKHQFGLENEHITELLPKVHATLHLLGLFVCLLVCVTVDVSN